jgi:F0F1-type ATP synthase assembly protein I
LSYGTIRPVRICYRGRRDEPGNEVDLDFARFALGMVVGVTVGALIGYVIGDQIFNDASVGLGFGVVVGAGVGSLVGIIANS